MTTAGGGEGRQQHNNQPTLRAAKGGPQLVSRPPKGSGQQLLSKAAGNKSIDSLTINNYKSGLHYNATTNKKWEHKRQTVAGDQTT